jgi:hypothetical protein
MERISLFIQKKRRARRIHKSIFHPRAPLLISLHIAKAQHTKKSLESDEKRNEIIAAQQMTQWSRQRFRARLFTHRAIIAFALLLAYAVNPVFSVNTLSLPSLLARRSSPRRREMSRNPEDEQKTLFRIFIFPKRDVEKKEKKKLIRSSV